jgi:hypothetical protein
MKTLPVVGYMKGSQACTDALAKETLTAAAEQSTTGKDFSYGESKEEYKATRNTYLCTCS